MTECKYCHYEIEMQPEGWWATAAGDPNDTEDPGYSCFDTPSLDALDQGHHPESLGMKTYRVDITLPNVADTRSVVIGFDPCDDIVSLAAHEGMLVKIAHDLAAHHGVSVNGAGLAWTPLN